MKIKWKWFLVGVGVSVIVMLMGILTTIAHFIQGMRKILKPCIRTPNLSLKVLVARSLLWPIFWGIVLKDWLRKKRKEKRKSEGVNL